jgi:hypothetical protein
MSDARVWYITVDGATQGPFTAGEVRDQLQAGSINPQTYVFRQGLGNWIPLAQAPELGAAAGSSVAPRRRAGVRCRGARRPALS